MFHAVKQILSLDQKKKENRLYGRGNCAVLGSQITKEIMTKAMASTIRTVYCYINYNDNCSTPLKLLKESLKGTELFPHIEAARSTDELVRLLEILNRRVVFFIDKIERVFEMAPTLGHPIIQEILSFGEQDGDLTVLVYITGDDGAKVEKLCYAKLEAEEFAAYPSYLSGRNFDHFYVKI